YDELNEVLPSEEVSSEQIEDTMSMLSEMGINVVESEDDAEDTSADDQAEEEPVETLPVRQETRAAEPVERTDDPVRMYLREMGSVELLSREGEIAIAKRIEAGREAMIDGLCESPLTFQAIIIWRDELAEGKILLRDIIDLDATYAGPDAKAPQPAASNDNVAAANGAADPAANGAAAKPATNGAAAPAADEDSEVPADGEDYEDDEDDAESSMSLAAMEAELKPKVVATFDRIAQNYKKLSRLQDQNVERRLRNQT